MHTCIQCTLHTALSNTLPWFSFTLGHILIYILFSPIFPFCWMLTNHNEANMKRQIYDIHLFFYTYIHTYIHISSTINFPDHDFVYDCTSANASAFDFFFDSISIFLTNVSNGKKKFFQPNKYIKKQSKKRIKRLRLCHYSEFVRILCIRILFEGIICLAAKYF